MLRIVQRSLATSEHYRVLELQHGASPEDVKSAYARLAKQYHPDTTALSDKQEAAKIFCAITEAKDALLDQKVSDSSRQAYEDYKRKHPYDPPPTYSSEEPARPPNRRITLQHVVWSFMGLAWLTSIVFMKQIFGQPTEDEDLKLFYQEMMLVRATRTQRPS